MRQMTFDELAARRAQRQEARNKTCEIAVPDAGGACLVAHMPTDAKLTELFGRFIQAQGGADMLELVAQALYHCCPQLQDGKLREAIGVRDPLDVVHALFGPAELNQMGGTLLSFLRLVPDRNADAADTPPENPAKN